MTAVISFQQAYFYSCLRCL